MKLNIHKNDFKKLKTNIFEIFFKKKNKYNVDK